MHRTCKLVKKSHFLNEFTEGSAYATRAFCRRGVRLGASIALSPKQWPDIRLVAAGRAMTAIPGPSAKVRGNRADEKTKRSSLREYRLPFYASAPPGPSLANSTG